MSRGMEQGWGLTERCYGRVGEEEAGRGPREPAWMCAPTHMSSHTLGFSSRRQGPAVSAGSRVESAACTSE